MSWNLSLATHPFFLQREHTDETPPVIIGHPTMQVDPPGDCVQLNVDVGDPVTLAARPRDIVHYSEDGHALFAGVVITCPAPDSRGVGPADSDADALQRVSVAGGRILMQDSVCGPLLIEDRTDIGVVALAYCQLYAHPRLVIDVANIPASTGTIVPNWYSPYRQLADLMDDLVQRLTAGGSWWVDAELKVHLHAEVIP